MIQFHGWAVIRYHTHDTDRGLQDACWKQLSDYVDSIHNELIRLQRYNGCDSVIVAGMHNHRADYVFDLFQWIANNAMGAYGILYIHDDEDQSRTKDYSNVFRVWQLCRGDLTENDDPFLSPFVPTVEDPYDETRDD